MPNEAFLVGNQQRNGKAPKGKGTFLRVETTLALGIPG
jgi:hypothetical protein